MVIEMQLEDLLSMNFDSFIKLQFRNVIHPKTVNGQLQSLHSFSLRHFQDHSTASTLSRMKSLPQIRFLVHTSEWLDHVSVETESNKSILCCCDMRDPRTASWLKNCSRSVMIGNPWAVSSSVYNESTCVYDATYTTDEFALILEITRR